MKKIMLGAGLLIYSSLLFSETELPHPCTFNCGNDDQSSPLSFHVDFETNKWKTRLKPNNKGMGWTPFSIREDQTGNRFVAITVKDGWNRDTGSKNTPTERAELETKKFISFGKEVWYGFKVKVPKDFKVIWDRVMLTQFKHRTRTRPSPMIGISQVSPNRPRIGLSICGQAGGKGSVDIHNTENGNRPLKCGKNWVDGRFEYNPTHEFEKLLTTEWSSFVIGSYVTHENNGFIKIYHNENLIYFYKGPTYGWSKIAPSNIRIGIYRDGDEYGEGHPPQTIHFDDFVVAPAFENVSQVLWGR